MRLIFVPVILVLFLLACGSGPTKTDSLLQIENGINIGAGITRFHDDELSVTCWRYEGFKKGGLSCVPDHQLKEK